MRILRSGLLPDSVRGVSAGLRRRTHDGPNESAELPGDGGHRLVRMLAQAEPVKFLRKTMLCFHRNADDHGRLSLSAPIQDAVDPRFSRLPEDRSDGTSPAQAMRARGDRNFRTSPISVARTIAVSVFTPLRYASASTISGTSSGRLTHRSNQARQDPAPSPDQEEPRDRLIRIFPLLSKQPPPFGRSSLSRQGLPRFRQDPAITRPAADSRSPGGSTGRGC